MLCVSKPSPVSLLQLGSQSRARALIPLDGIPRTLQDTQSAVPAAGHSALRGPGQQRALLGCAGAAPAAAPAALQLLQLLLPCTPCQGSWELILPLH